MSYKFKDLEVNWEIIYDFLYVFLINFSIKHASFMKNNLNYSITFIWPFNVIQGQIL